MQCWMETSLHEIIALGVSLSKEIFDYHTTTSKLSEKIYQSIWEEAAPLNKLEEVQKHKPIRKPGLTHTLWSYISDNNYHKMKDIYKENIELQDLDSNIIHLKTKGAAISLKSTRPEQNRTHRRAKHITESYLDLIWSMFTTYQVCK